MNQKGLVAPPVAIVLIAVIGIGGYVFLRYQKTQRDNVSAPAQNQYANTPQSPVPNPLSLTVAVPADWKTYRNEKYGFEVKYPPTGSVAEIPAEPDRVVSAVDFAMEGITVRVGFYKNGQDNTLKKFFQARSGVGVSETGAANDYRQISLNGTLAVKRADTLSGGRKIGASVLILGDQYYYVVSTGNQYSPDFDASREATFDTFLSTFKFAG